MLFRKKYKPTPVDRGWIESEARRVAIDVASLAPAWSFDSREAYQMINAMCAARDDVFDATTSGYMYRGNKLIKLCILPGYDLREAFTVIATLWQATTGRMLTLVPGEPPAASFLL